MLDNSYTSIFKFFLAVSKIVKEISSWDTYGSFRQDFLTDKKGKLIKTDKVFLNIYDYGVDPCAKKYQSREMVPSKSCSFKKKTFKEKVEKGKFLQVVAHY